jgi:hypothetical protein
MAHRLGRALEGGAHVMAYLTPFLSCFIVKQDDHFRETKHV